MIVTASHDEVPYVRKRRRRIISAITVIVVLILGTVYALSMRPSSNQGVSPSVNSPSQQPAEPTSQPVSQEQAESEAQLASVRTEMNDRVIAFETAYRAFDWQQPDYPSDVASEYMLPSLVEELKASDEEEQFLREKRVNARAVRTVVSATVTYGEIAEDRLMAEFTCVVTVSILQDGETVPDQISITSQTSWVNQDGTWLVATITPA